MFQPQVASIAATQAELSTDGLSKKHGTFRYIVHLLNQVRHNNGTALTVQVRNPRLRVVKYLSSKQILKPTQAINNQGSGLQFPISMDLPSTDRSIILKDTRYHNVLNRINQKIRTKLRDESLDGEITYTLTSEHPRPGSIYFTLKVWCSVYHETFDSLLEDVDCDLYHELKQLPHMVYIIPEI